MAVKKPSKPKPKQLGKPTPVPVSPAEALLERVANPHPETLYAARFTAPEFTCLCPITGQPDFGEIRVTYVPDELCIELKSLKLYFFAYRQRGVFYEAATNQILDDLVAACRPRRMTVVGDFTPRGGIRTCVTATYAKP